MKKTNLLMSVILATMSSGVFAGAFNLHRGDLLDTDTIDVELREQEGNCNTPYPLQDINCAYSDFNTKDLLAVHIDEYSQHIDMTTTNTYLLNVSVNGTPLSSCQLLQAKIMNHTLITINKTGCVIS